MSGQAPETALNRPGPPAAAFDAPSLTALRYARVRRDTALRRRLMPVALFAAAIMAVTIARGHPGPGTSGSSLGVAVALGAFVAAIIGVLGRFGAGLFMGSRPRPCSPFFLYALGLLVLSSATLVWFQPRGSAAVTGMFLAIAGAARALPVQRSAVLLAACLIFLMVRLSPIAAIALVAVYTMGMFGRRIRAHEEEEERLLTRLEESRHAELTAVALGERQRLARDMHDVLAHSLSGLVMQLEGARLLAASDPEDGRLPVAIDRAHQLAKNGLAEARQAIATLRDEELPGPERIAALAEAFESDTGIPCRFTVAGEARALGSSARLALYRVAQEALTNVRKHASPDRVDVRLEYLPAEVSLVVEDHGAPPSGAETNGGYGITGMRERAELLGGTIDAGPTEDGFLVWLRVPA